MCPQCFLPNVFYYFIGTNCLKLLITAGTGVFVICWFRIRPRDDSDKLFCTLNISHVFWIKERYCIGI